LRATLDKVVVRSTGGPVGDQRACQVHEPPSPTDEGFAIAGAMVIFFVFLLGIGNFALHRAVLNSGHPALAHLAWAVRGPGAGASLVLEFALLLVALLLAAGGHAGWAWVYFAYSALNALAAWLILSRRM
jgi:hypothetical protein